MKNHTKISFYKFLDDFQTLCLSLTSVAHFVFPSIIMTYQDYIIQYYIYNWVFVHGDDEKNGGDGFYFVLSYLQFVYSSIILSF